MSGAKDSRTSSPSSQITKFKHLNERQTKVARLCIQTLVALTLLLLLLSSASPSEGKIIKLKNLKKAKKYLYLLAPQRKKLYAIPFPVPLPVFVKRQHIYTQIPIIPQYVQQPYYAAQPSHQDAYEVYGSMSAPAPELYSAHPQTSQTHKPIGPYNRKYLAQIAANMSKKHPMVAAASNQRDLFAKLLSGQAKILTPRPIRVANILTGLKQLDTEANSQETQTGGNRNLTSPSKSEPSDQASTSEREPSSSGSSLRAPIRVGPVYEISPAMPPFAAYAPGQATLPQLLQPQPLEGDSTQAVDQQALTELHQRLGLPIGHQWLRAHSPQPHELSSFAAAAAAAEYEQPGEGGQSHQGPVSSALTSKIIRLHPLAEHQHLQTAGKTDNALQVARANSLLLEMHPLAMPIRPDHLRLVNY